LFAATNLGAGGGSAMFAPAISPHDPMVMFVACDLTGLYRSTDGGDNWALLNSRDVSGSSRFSVAFDPNTPGHIVAVHRQQGLKESYDNGVTWAAFSPALPTYYPNVNPQVRVVITAVAVLPSLTRSVAVRLLVGTTKGVFTLAVDHWDWTLMGTDLIADGQTVNTAEVITFAFAHEPVSPGALTSFVATVTNVYSSSDRSTWVAFGDALPNRPLGAYVPTFVGSSPSDYHASRIRDFAAAEDSTRYVLYVTVLTSPTEDPQLGGVYRYEKTATSTPTWIRQNDGLNLTLWIHQDPLTRCGSVSVPVYEHIGVARQQPDTLYVTVVQITCSPDVYKASLIGNRLSWNGVYDGYQSHPTTTNLTPGWIEVSNPIGLDWGFGGTAVGFTVDPNTPDTALYTNLAAVHRTTNGAGRTSPPPGKRDWGVIYTRLTEGTIGTTSARWATTGLDVTNTWDYAIDPSNNNVHFILNTDAGLSLSINSGASWQPILIQNLRVDDHPLWGNYYQLAFDPVVAGRIWAAVSNQHDIPYDYELTVEPNGGVRAGDILVSNDHGATWQSAQPTTPTLPLGPVVSVIYKPGTTPTLFASVWGSGVYKSTDFGSSWAAAGTTLPSRPFVYRLRLDPNGTVHVVVAADARGSTVQHGGLYYLDSSNVWQKLTQGLETQLGGAIVAPMDYTFDPASPGTIYLCLADYFRSTGGDAWRYTNGTWSRLNIPFPNSYWNTHVAFAPFVIGNTLYVTTLTHGIWTTQNGSSWTEYGAIPYLDTLRLTPAPGINGPLYVTTLGAGVWRVP